MIELPITPVSKPRQTRSDKWQKRPCVMRYREFADTLRFLSRVKAPNLSDAVLDGAAVQFVIPLPKSWSKKKKSMMAGTGHTQKPDIDNLVKAFLDAIMKDDSGVSSIAARKIWGEHGAIHVKHFNIGEIFE